MRWDVKLLEGVNSIKFGMDMDEVRKLIDLPCKFLPSSIDFGLNEDAFGNSCKIEYDKENKMTGITINDEDGIFIDGKQVFPGTLAKFKKFADDFEKDDCGYISKSKSIGIYAPYGKIEAVTFGGEGYYDFEIDPEELLKYFKI